MNRRRFGLLAASTAAVALTGCAQSKFKTYTGPQVTTVLIEKDARKMRLMHYGTVLKEYDFELGFAPVGDKQQRGDGRTPEGIYFVDRRNPNSAFHLSIGINYPNAEDIAEAEALGVDPGGDIFIHGQPNAFKAKGDDWTAGCIAVTNKEMEDIYAMVRNGTVVAIRP